MEHHERRRAERLPVGLYVQQIIDGEPHRCFATSMSLTGMYIEHVTTRFARRSRVVQLEIPLTGDAEPIWVGGEVVYDALDRLFVGTAIAFQTMADRDRKRLAAWLDRGALDADARPIWLSMPVASRRLH
jgi:hypothetical protein